mmetsp:Transcript_20560/g.44939  ORF Transcript_20560/g.44939 Transcript_20560/m.44939 type:complete len:205 (+) Transcript_20560:3715-4329(+)
MWSQLPPDEGPLFKVRTRFVWPPSQVLSHLDHADQSETRQSLGSSTSQGLVSWRLSLQGLPDDKADSFMRRCRYICGQFITHSVHSVNSQSRTGQASTVHSADCRVVPWHTRPSWLASWATRLSRVCRPGPQVALQDVHSCQAVKLQSTGSGPSVHGSVSLDWPVQDLPPCVGICSRTLVRNFCLPVSPSTQALHFVHFPKRQS